MISLHDGDNRIALRRLIEQGVRVHAVVTDPPYGLVSVQKRFGAEGAAPARTEKNDGSFARLSGGFMGKQWDGTGIERDPAFWRLIWDILLPGGFCFAFSGSRTGHWQACAMEQAGFVMHPMHGWVYGTGFPKAHDAAAAIRKKFGAIPEAARWQGWKYGTQSQKPALEPIYLAQRPFSGKTGADNLLAHGVGAVNIDDCRVPTDEDLNGGAYAHNPTERDSMWGEDAGSRYRRGGAGEFAQPEGRYPANLLLDGSDEVAALFPQGKSGSPGVRRKAHETHSMSGALGLTGQTEVGYGDEGSAARFFHGFPLEEFDFYWLEQAGTISPSPDSPPIFYSAKANKEDRSGSKHPTVKPIGLLQYLIRHITPPGGIVLDPFAGTGTTGEAAKREGFDCILMEAEPEYSAFLSRRFAQPAQIAISTTDLTDLLSDELLV